MEYLAWFEQTLFSSWMRASTLAFFSSLILHALGMGFVVGVHVATNLRILGVAPRVPLSLMRRFRPVVRVGLSVTILSGLLLLVAYPAKALANPVFYLKLGSVIAALLIGRSLTNRLSRDYRDVGLVLRNERVLAAVSLVLWAGAITTGRLLAYTRGVILASHLY